MRIIPLFFLMLTLTVALTGAAVLCFQSVQKKGGSLLRIDVAVAGGSGDKMTEKAVGLVQQMDVVKSVCRFHRVSVKEADEKVRDGQYDAALYLTDHMYQDINQGYNTPVVIKLADHPSFSGKLFCELIETGVRDLQTAEATVYAVYDLSEEYPTGKPAEKIANKMAARFIKLFLGRGTVFKTSVLSPYGEMTGIQFAVFSLMLILPLLLGMGFASFYGNDEILTGRSLARIGVPRWFQSGVKIIVMTVLIWVFMMLTEAVCRIPEALRPAASVNPVFLILPAFGITAYIHLIYSLIPDESGSCLYLVISALMLVFAGGIFPPSLMPRIAGGIARVLPFFGWQRFLSATAGGASAGYAAVMVVAAAAVMIAAAEAAVCIRQRGGAL